MQAFRSNINYLFDKEVSMSLLGEIQRFIQWVAKTTY